MKYGLLVANIGSYSDPRFVAELAADAEAAGWDGLFIWDHLAFAWGMPTADPWVTLTACALRTSRIVLGPGITPVPRRRVQDLALTLATLDRLSGGRVVFGAGLGGNRGEFERFGESFSRRRRVELLTEGLATLRAWFDGDEVNGIQLKPPPTGACTDLDRREQPGDAPARRPLRRLVREQRRQGRHDDDARGRRRGRGSGRRRRDRRARLLPRSHLPPTTPPPARPGGSRT